MNLKGSAYWFGLVASAWALSACTVKEERIVEKQAPADIKESFRPASCDKAACVTIQKDSLGKIFLLLASGKTAGSTPQWYDLKPLVVSFEKSGGRLALLSENYTSIYEEIRTVNLLQTFAIVSENEKEITFDWGQGLKTFIQQSSYDVDGVRGKGVDLTESSFKSIPVLDSFVRNIKFDEKNLELEQISKVSSEVLKAGSEKTFDLEAREETLAMNIQIRSYDLSQEFQKKEFDKSRRVGFFVTKVAKPGYSQELTNLITKWDLSDKKGPIQVRISSAVPQEYVTAVAEGALYWNKVFGKQAITVVTGVDPQESPRDRSITIRWIPWLDSGAAYAMGQSDPLTGEQLRAQVFMPSVFTRVGSADLLALNGGHPVVAVGATIACDLTPSLQALAKLSQEASDSQRLRLAQDSVRITVAHELGHALGLRHNFAGSFSAKVSTAEVMKSAKEYLQDLAHRGLETSTTVMDYVSGVDDVLLSAKIKYEALPYDKMAMDWAYSANDMALNEKVSLYCTDDDIALGTSQGLGVYGCERFDAGNNPLLRKYLNTKNEKENFVRTLFVSILGRMFPGDKPEVVNDLDAVLKDTQKFGRLNTDDLEFVSGVLLQNSSSATFASLASVKSGMILQSKMGLDFELDSQRLQSLKEAGGYAAILNGLSRNSQGLIDIKWLQEQIEVLKNSDYLVRGKNLSGRDYELTKEQQDKVIRFFEGLLNENKKTLLKGITKLLPSLDEKSRDSSGKVVTTNAVLFPGLVQGSEVDELASLADDMLQLSMSTKGAKLGQGGIKEVLLPVYELSKEDRLKWASLLSSKGLSFNMELKKALVVKRQKEKVETVLNQIEGLQVPGAWEIEEKLATDLFAKGLIDSTAMSWLTEEISVLKALEKLQ